MNAWIARTEGGTGSGGIEVTVKDGAVVRIQLGSPERWIAAEIPGQTARSMGRALIEIADALEGKTQKEQTR